MAGEGRPNAMNTGRPAALVWGRNRTLGRAVVPRGLTETLAALRLPPRTAARNLRGHPHAALTERLARYGPFRYSVDADSVRLHDEDCSNSPSPKCDP